MEFTYYGHSCFSLAIAGKHILFDPFIAGNDLAKDIDVERVQADYILVSHGHSDHVGDLVSIARRTGATVVAAFEVTEWVATQGCTTCHPMNLGGKKVFDWGTVKMVPAWHSSVLPDGTYGANPAGFVITTAEGNFYYSGDTSLMMDMQLIPRYAQLDFAILPVGDNFTMGPDDALIAAEFIQCTKIIGVHFDTFGFIKIDHAQSQKLFREAGRDLILPEIGKSINV